jgi:hypothetical protein
VDRTLRRLRLRAREKSIAASRTLDAFAEKWSSQNGEDGILRELFARIPNSRFFVEFGVEDGSECNAALLAERYGWSGVFIEASDRHYADLRARYAAFPAIRCVHAFVRRDNIVDIFRANEVPVDLDLLSIDIDGNDYWIWETLAAYRAKVVVIEYNATLGAERSITIPYDDDHVWAHDRYFGASLGAFRKLGERLGYALIGTEPSGVNAFFVRRDLLETCGFPEVTAREAHRRNRAGDMLWPPGKTEFIDV